MIDYEYRPRIFNAADLLLTKLILISVSSNFTSNPKYSLHKSKHSLAFSSFK